jgi:hypothetical protein
VHKRQDRIGKLLVARRFIFGDRNIAQKHFDFGQYALRYRLARDRERRSVRRVAMHHALDLRPGLHDRQVQPNLARSLALA